MMMSSKIKRYETREFYNRGYRLPRLLKLIHDEFPKSKWKLLKTRDVKYVTCKIRFRESEDLTVFILKYGHIYGRE